MYLLDEKSEMLCLATHTGLSDNFINKPMMQIREVGIGLLGQTVLTGKARIINNFLRSEDPFVDCFLEEGFQSSAYIPLVSKGKPVGVMCVSNRSEFKFSDEHISFLMAIGNQIGLAVDHANLYEDIKKAYQDLKLAQEQIVRNEKMASLGKLAATIAHEINNPMAAILNYIKLIKKLITKGRFLPEKIPDITRFLNIMDTETVRCGEIVKSLLAFSRESNIEMKKYSIEEIVDRTMNIIDHDLKIRKIKLIKEIEPHLPPIKCDIKQIQQALLNIISNAAEAITGGGIITVAAKRSENNGFLDIAISDTGCGISKENIENVFEPFFTTKEEGKGVGLGLSVVYGIITKHQGSVMVESEPGQGSVFKVQLPIARYRADHGDLMI
jgi:signal transduction histidine kinase